MIKYLVMDVDGTLTDGKIYMGPTGEAMKAFSVKDGYVIKSGTVSMLAGRYYVSVLVEVHSYASL